MYRPIVFISTFFIALMLVFSSSIDAANAHGIGGIEPGKTISKIKSIEPKTDLFNVEPIEHGDRIKVTRTSTQDVVVLGVDDEPYILINADGSFVNLKSATRLINKSANGDSRQIAKSEFEKTSIDPNQIPNWKKLSDSQSYAWHDHRSHYMGSVPSGVRDLGTSTLKIKSGNENFLVTFTFSAAKTSANPLLLIMFAIAIFGILIFFLLKKQLFIKLFNKSILLILLLSVGVLEAIHIWGYFVFSQYDVFNELTSTMYSIAFITFAALTILRLLLIHDPSKSWTDQLTKLSPLLVLTGFVGIFVGAIFEYKTFYYPYLPTIYSNLFSQLIVGLIALISLVLMLLGLANITQSEHKKEPSLASPDSIP